MIRWLIIGAGIVMILLGGIYFFQGIGVLLGSFMTGQPMWTTIGLILIVCGVALCVAGFRRKANAPKP